MVDPTPPRMDLSKAKSADVRDDTNSDANGGDNSPIIITKEKQVCHDKFNSLPVVVEGPELLNDFSYFL